LTVTNTLGYNETELVTAVKSFIVQAFEFNKNLTLSNTKNQSNTKFTAQA